MFDFVLGLGGCCYIAETYLNDVGRMREFIKMIKSYYDGNIMAAKQVIHRIHGKDSSKTLTLDPFVYPSPFLSNTKHMNYRSFLDMSR